MKNNDATKAQTARMSVGEYRDRLHNYSQKFLLCKDIRHVWKVETPYSSFPKNPDWVQRVLVCSRCGTVRTDNFHLDQATQRMQRGASSYRYPAGFSMRGLPQERNLSEIMRYETYLRALAQVNAKETKQ